MLQTSLPPLPDSCPLSNPKWGCVRDTATVDSGLRIPGVSYWLRSIIVLDDLSPDESFALVFSLESRGWYRYEDVVQDVYSRSADLTQEACATSYELQIRQVVRLLHNPAAT